MSLIRAIWSRVCVPWGIFVEGIEEDNDGNLQVDAGGLAEGVNPRVLDLVGDEFPPSADGGILGRPIDPLGLVFGLGLLLLDTLGIIRNRGIVDSHLGGLGEQLADLCGVLGVRDDEGNQVGVPIGETTANIASENKR